VAHARALLPSVAFVEHDAARDAGALERLAVWMSRFSPTVGVDGSHVVRGAEADTLLLDVTGIEAVFRSERALRGLVEASLRGLGVFALTATASTVGAAWAAVRSGVETLPDLSEESALRLESLPVTGLRLPRETLLALDELGLERIGQVTSLARETLPSRFGGLLVRRLDEMFGRVHESPEPVRVESAVTVDTTFEGPTTDLETVCIASRHLLERLSDELERKGLGVRSLVMRADRLREDLRTTEVLTHRLEVSRATRSAAHLWKLLRPGVEALDMGCGIEGVSLLAAKTGRAGVSQGVLSETGVRGPERRSRAGSVNELVDVLASRLGGERIRRYVVTGTRVPERAWNCVPASWDGAGGTLAMTAWPQARPSVLFSPAEGVQVLSADENGLPVVFRARGVVRVVLRTTAPERLGGEWWKTPIRAGDSATMACLSFREYIRVLDDGGHWWWMYRVCSRLGVAGDGRDAAWWLQGVWA